MNFQVMITDLTGMDVSNCSLLDEATAAGEALSLCLAEDRRLKKNAKPVFVVSSNTNPQTIDVLRSRGYPRHVKIVVVDHLEDNAALLKAVDASAGEVLCGALIQYPGADGVVTKDMNKVAENVHNAGGLLVCATDLMALTQLEPPGKLGADICVGSAQRFGVPMGYGGPHAAFFASKT